MKKRRKTLAHHVVHHAKRAYHVTPRFVHGMVIGAFVGLVIVFTFGSVLPVGAVVSLNSVRDCDTNAVINCGTLNTTELQQRYYNTGVATIYNHFGISAADINRTHDTAQVGRVYKNGQVTIGDTVVATGAITAGRHNISGSTKHVINGTTFYTRAPSVSFRVDSIAAFVIMNDGQFKYAILAACGNPVMATPIPKKETPPPPAPPEEPPVEEPPTTSSLAPPPSTQTPKSTPLVLAETSPQILPVTGPGEIGLVAILAVIGGYVYHVTHRHIRRRRAERQQ